MRSATFVPLLLLVPIVVVAQATEHFTDPNSRTPVFINEIHVTGTQSLDSTQLNEIIGPLNQLKVGGTDEISERLRFQFQNYGYFLVNVKSVETKRLDPLAKLPPVDVEAEVEEGPRFRFGDIQFTGTHALTAEELRTQFPIRTGEFFSRNEVGKGLEALGEVYGKLGYMDLYCIPEVTTSDEKVSLKIEVHEGRQFHMGALQLAGNPDLADQLRPLWKLETGQPYDRSYLAEFFKDNESLFPQYFSLNNSTKIARNCQDNTVTVFMKLGPNHPSVPVPNDVGCDKP